MTTAPLHLCSFEVNEACDRVVAVSEHLGIPRAEALRLVALRFGERIAEPTTEASLLEAAADLGIDLAPASPSSSGTNGDGRRSQRRVALDLAKAVGMMARLHDQLETALINFADFVTDSDTTAAELRDEINALSNRIESWGRTINARTEHLA